ncbi:cation channel sperm-associated auxiliary subunit delta [Gavia stellata]|uniref:cation channel sperm-associated auxiliary subunit delta n=1 Tax=Gavia stellata TaxID=37040 RepID=UPI002896CA96|nr:cation channel sperm-associated auxiliary subunit delta [Gavia stellata]
MAYVTEMSTATVDFLDNPISCIDVAPLTALVALSCPPTTFQEHVPAGFFLFEINGMHNYDYLLTVHDASCTSQPQNWTSSSGFEDSRER